MKSLYEEEAPSILKKIEEGIRQRVETTGPDETVGLLEFMKERISRHKGEYIRLPKVPISLDIVDTVFIKELFSTSDTNSDFYRHLMYQNWSDRFSDLVTDKAE